MFTKKDLCLAVCVGVMLFSVFLVKGRMATAESQSIQMSGSPHTQIDPESLETLLDEYIPENDEITSPGLSLVVVKGEEIVYQKGFGLADGPPIRLAF